MDKEIVEFLLNTFIRKLFPNTSVEQVNYRVNRSFRVIRDKSGKTIKVNLSGQSGLTMQRSFPFEDLEVAFVRSLFTSAMEYSSLPVRTQIYLNRVSYHRVIARSLSEGHAPGIESTVFQIINLLERWGGETYEGDPIVASFGLSLSEEILDDTRDNLEQIVANDFAKVISNGHNTLIEVDGRGVFLDYRVVEEDLGIHTAPLEYTAFAKYSEDRDRMAFVLTPTHEILVFKDGSLACAKRRGDWRFFHHLPMVHQLAFDNRKLGVDIRKAVYESSLDLSFSRSGGCIGIVQKNREHQLHKDSRVHPRDNLNLRQSVKSRVLHSCCGNIRFQDLDRRIRRELLCIDGATLLDSEGRILTTGSIIKLDSGSEAGARLAAAKCLSHYGISIKISTDGEIQVFNLRDQFNFA